MDESRRCTATSKQTGNRCGRAAIPGGTVCNFHGGKAPQTIAVAQRRLVEQQATRELAKIEVVPIGDPVVALAEVAAELRAGYEVAKAQAVDKGAPDSAWMAFYERQVDRLSRVLEACGRLGLEERRVKLEEDKLDLLARVMVVFLSRRGIDADLPDVQADLEVAYREVESVQQ